MLLWRAFSISFLHRYLNFLSVRPLTVGRPLFTLQCALIEKKYVKCYWIEQSKHSNTLSQLCLGFLYLVVCTCVCLHASVVCRLCACLCLCMNDSSLLAPPVSSKSSVSLLFYFSGPFPLTLHRVDINLGSDAGDT